MSTAKYKLSLFAAILININIMMGSGVFINVVELAKRSGILCGFTYIVLGILVLPLIVSIGQLIKIHPAGGFYIFGRKEISPFVGFISAWSYFVGKLASATLTIHIAVLLLQQIIPILQTIPTLALDFGILSLFIILNLQNIQTGRSIQNVFISLKMIPIFFIIFGGLFLTTTKGFASFDVMWSGIPSSLPLVLYAIAGFEASCALSSKIQNAKRNGPLAVFISFGVVILLAFLFQFLFYAALGTQLATQSSFLQGYPAFVKALFTLSPTAGKNLAAFLYIAIASSSLGASYGILYSNSWNLFAIAQHKHTFFHRFITQLNKHQIPLYCVIVEGLICSVYLFVTKGSQLSLQQLGALGAVIGYTISVLALLIAKIKRPQRTSIYLWVPILALANCALLASTCIKNFFTSGLIPLYAFIGLIVIGSVMFYNTEGRKLSITMDQN